MFRMISSLTAQMAPALAAVPKILFECNLNCQITLLVSPTLCLAAKGLLLWFRISHFMLKLNFCSESRLRCYVLRHIPSAYGSVLCRRRGDERERTLADAP
jgi:hypothetical protein